ncbi:hypothetical protein HDU87_001423 [Geranomyces variabilis]|uniref:Uncharacterized protein n=1 Tax=Geranomyces variabilis TaxID=109894 RepID=A0AAD5TBP2_9FUNG|nr:hypothetical protein HDU87_001423 [Geranomyces variabilis]
MHIYIHRFPAAITVRIKKTNRGDLRGSKKDKCDDIWVHKYGQSKDATTTKRAGASFFEPNIDYQEQCHQDMMKVSGAGRDTCRTGKVLPLVTMNALETYPAKGTEIIELDLVRQKVNSAYGTAITLQSTETIDRLLPQMSAASLWLLTGFIDEFSNYDQYDEFLRETHEMSILQAMTQQNIADVATQEYVDKHMSTRVICGSVQVILPSLERPLHEAQVIECNS